MSGLISAYIPCRNNATYLPAAIASVRSLALPIEELLVIDDGSQDGSADVAEAAGARVIRHQSSLGRGAARARAFSEARGEFVLGLDATCTIEPGSLAAAMVYFTRGKVAGVSWRCEGPPAENVIERWRARHLYQEGIKREAYAADLFPAACVLRRSAVLETGNFNPHLQHSEDAELSARLRSAGWELWLDPNLIVRVHKQDTLASVLERYWRWHVGPAGHTSLRAYAQKILYSAKVMARQDVQARDWPAAAISLVCPHYQYWRSAFQRQEPPHSAR